MSKSKSKNANFSIDALKDKQSVRATFTLSTHTIHLLSTVANQLGVKQKSVFDHLVENKHLLGKIAGEARNYHPTQQKRKQKTFVLSKNSLKSLNAFAREYELPRNVLVEVSLKQLHPVIEEEKQKNENRKMLLKEMDEVRLLTIQLIEKSRLLVGEDDETSRNLDHIKYLYEKQIDELKKTIEKGKAWKKFNENHGEQKFCHNSA